MNQLSPQARQLLRLAHDEDEPNVCVLQRVETSLALRIAAGVGAAATGTVVTQAAAEASTLGTWLKAAALVGIAGAVVGAGLWASGSLPQTARHGNAAPSTELVAHAPTVVAPDPASIAQGEKEGRLGTVAEGEQPLMTRNPLPDDWVQAKRRPLPLAKVDASVTPDPLQAEILDLRSAQQALRAGDARRVLLLLDHQDARYPNGVMQEERAAARVLALCQSSQISAAQAAAERFERRWPKSSLVARVRSSCWSP